MSDTNIEKIQIEFVPEKREIKKDEMFFEA